MFTPHDANEGFRTGGRGGSGAQPDPLAVLAEGFRDRAACLPAEAPRSRAARRAIFREAGQNTVVALTNSVWPWSDGWPNSAVPLRGGERQARQPAQCWSSLMARTFGCDVLACPGCGGRLRLIALIEEAAVIRRILRHLGVPTEVPVPCPARAPPLRVDAPDHADWEDGTAVFTSGA